MSGKTAKRKRRASRTVVERWLRQYVLELRKLLKQRAPEQRARFPNMRPPCHTCAFNPATDNWKGWDQTAINLKNAIENDQPFYCHENMPQNEDGWYVPEEMRDKLQLCAGYATIVGASEAKWAALYAAGKLQDAPDYHEMVDRMAGGCSSVREDGV